jgi:hypothetical protein
MLGKGAEDFSKDLTDPLSAELKGALGKTFDDTVKGPLDKDLAATFKDGKYTVGITDEPRRFMRAGDADAARSPQFGQFWSDEAPESVTAVRREFAVLPEWPGGGKSPLNTGYDVEFPAGTVFYYGEVAPQGAGYPGGAMQYVIKTPWAIRPEPPLRNHWPLKP